MTPPPKDDLSWTAFLVPSTVLILALILAFVYWQYPRQSQPPAFGGRMQVPPPPQAEWWERLFSSERPNDEHNGKAGPQDQWTQWWEKQKRRDVRVRSRRASAPPGADKRRRQQEQDGNAQFRGPRSIAEVVNDDHLALRQLVLAEAIVNYREGGNPGAVRRIRRSVPDGPYRVQEEKRYRMEQLWALYHDHVATQAQLDELADVADSMASSQYQSFEDQANAGLAMLLAGRVDDAIPRLIRALNEWPANDRVRGDLYLFLMCAYGIKGDDERFISMLLKFKENYQDWLYVETYLPHLRHLNGQFPDAPALAVVHGHVMTLVHNDREAAQNYDRALANPRLGRRLRQNVAFWRRALMERVQPSTSP